MRATIRKILKEETISRMERYADEVFRYMVENTEWERFHKIVIVFRGVNISVNLDHKTTPPGFYFVPDVIRDFILKEMAVPLEVYPYIWEKYSDYVISMWMSRK